MFAISVGQYVCIAMVVNICAICGDMPRWEMLNRDTGETAARLGEHRTDGLAHGHRVSWFAVLDTGVAQRVDEVVVARVRITPGAENAVATVIRHPTPISARTANG